MCDITHRNINVVNLAAFKASLTLNSPQPCITRTATQLRVKRTKCLLFTVDGAATPAILGRRAVSGR